MIKIKIGKKYSKRVISSFLERSKDLYPEYKMIYKKDFILVKNKKKISKKEINSLNNTLDIIERLEEKKIYYKSNKKIIFKKDPLPYLEKKNEIKRIDEGLFQFHGVFLKIFRKLDLYFYNLATKKYNGIDQENPILWPIDLFKKINYFSEFPQQILLVSALKKNSRNYKKFADKHSIDKRFSSIKIDTSFENSKFGLQPAVCDNCYYALSNLKKFKNTVYTTFNKVFRNELSQNNSLDRLISFSVRDIMFVGNKKFVKNIRDKLLGELKNFFKMSGLNFSIEIANDPFFIGKINKNIFQQSHELKYEIIVKIPFLKKNIAVGSINYHLDTFGRAFNIKNKREFIYSGCIGIGFERLMLALYSQHGTDINKWPSNFLKFIKFKK